MSGAASGCRTITIKRAWAFRIRWTRCHELYPLSPAGWYNAEKPLWQAFVDAPKMLVFVVEDQTPITFNPNRDPDPYAEVNGGKAGRNVSLGLFVPSRRGLGKTRSAGPP